MELNGVAGEVAFVPSFGFGLQPPQVLGSPFLKSIRDQSIEVRGEFDYWSDVHYHQIQSWPIAMKRREESASSTLAVLFDI